MAVVIALQWDATYKSRIIPARNMHLLWGLESHARLRLKKKKRMVVCFHMAWIRLPHTPIISILNVSSLQATGQLSHFNFTFVSFSDLCK